MWPFQLNQYELPSSTTSHRLAWGSNYGAVGQRTVTSFGQTFSGYPFFSYSVFMVVGPRSTGPTLAHVAEIDHISGAELTASIGTVRTEGPAGIGRTDTRVYSPAGYSPLYGTWELTAASGAVTALLNPKAGPLTSPILHISGFSKSQARVYVDGVEQNAEVAFVSVDAARSEMWLTLNGAVGVPVTIHVE
jgi:hypothetical protein